MIACLLKIIPEKGNLRNNFEKLLIVMEKIDEILDNKPEKEADWRSP